MNILSVTNLKTHIHTTHGTVKAVDGVSFNIQKGEVFGLVGESGSGKSMTALSILRLLPRQAKIVSGEVLFNGRDIMRFDSDELRKTRGARVSIVFQEPSSALDPVFTIGYQMEEAVLAHTEIRDSRRIRRIVHDHMDKVHIKDPSRIAGSFPHQLSGGTKQRVMIAMALLNSPELIILDEPTTALDVTIQAQILDLLEEIIDKEKLSILFISHDFGVISKMCDRVGVMYKGRIVEAGNTADIIEKPKMEYTRTLLESVKVLE